MLVWLLVANCALALVYAIWKGRRHESIALTAFFLLLPGIGFLIYFLPCLVRGRGAAQSAACDPKILTLDPAMVVSDDERRRTYLLNARKKDLKDNYKMLMATADEDDPESAYYMSTAKTEIYRLQQTHWLECRRAYEANPDDPEIYHEACALLDEMVSSEILSAAEEKAYRKLLCEVIQRQIDHDERVVTPQEYGEYLTSLVALGEYAKAEGLWAKHADQMRSETVYRAMLKMYYEAGERRKFTDLVNDLAANRQVRLSPQGLEQLRYWKRRIA